MVKVGDKLVHPIHGLCTVHNIRKATDDKGDRISGLEIIARFDRYIEGVKWVWDDVDGSEKSQLIFNSKYLDRFKKL